jgi:hypothetical protein
LLQALVVSFSVVWLCLTLVYIWREAKPLIVRKLVISETRAESERLAIVRPSVKDDDPMPQDMIDWAMSENSDWARDDKIARMRELYVKLGNWEKVRRAMMAEEEVSLKSTFS